MQKRKGDLSRRKCKKWSKKMELRLRQTRQNEECTIVVREKEKGGVEEKSGEKFQNKEMEEGKEWKMKIVVEKN